MGYEDTLSQFSNILLQMNVSYVDLTLNHWPTSTASPTVDAACDPQKPTYNAKTCRLNTWRAYVELFQNGTSKAIGVANYNSTHLQEIIDAGMPLPSVNQIPIHLYTYAAQKPTIDWCKAHNITVLAYSPFGERKWRAAGRLLLSTAVAWQLPHGGNALRPSHNTPLPPSPARRNP